MGVAGVLLAAGESARMGQLKPLLPWRGTTLLESQITQLQAAGMEPLVVVLGYRAEELRAVLDRHSNPRAPVHVVYNARCFEGKSTSIVAGISALPDESLAVVLVAADQPCEAGVVRALVVAHGASGAKIVLPSVNHRRGHPTLFDRGLFPDLLAVTEQNQGLREVMVRHENEIEYVDVATELVRANLNSPVEYEAAYQRWGR